MLNYLKNLNTGESRAYYTRNIEDMSFPIGEITIGQVLGQMSLEGNIDMGNVRPSKYKRSAKPSVYISRDGYFPYGYFP